MKKINSKLIFCFLLFWVVCSLMGQDFTSETGFEGLSEPELLLDSLHDMVEDIFQSDFSSADNIANEIDNKIFQNPNVQYNLLLKKEQKLWEDLLFSMELYKNYALIFKDFPQFARSPKIQLQLIKMEPLDFPASEIIAFYSRTEIKKIGAAISAAEVASRKSGGAVDLDVLEIFNRFKKRLKKDSRFIRRGLEEIYKKDYTFEDYLLLDVDIKKFIKENQQYFMFLSEGDQSVFLKLVFYYCVYSSFDFIFSGLTDKQIETIKYELLRDNKIDSPSHRKAVYNYFIRKSVFFHSGDLIENDSIKRSFTDDFSYDMLLSRDQNKNTKINLYLNYITNLAFNTNAVLQDSAMNSFSLGLFSTISDILPWLVNDLDLILSGYFSYNSYNYESVLENNLYTQAAAGFNSVSINGGVGFSFLELEKGDILKIRPLCFQFIMAYIFYNRIDTKFYGNILLEDALQPLFKGKYFIDIEIDRNLDIFFELHYSRYSTPVYVDANIPLFYTGAGLSFLFNIY